MGSHFQLRSSQKWSFFQFEGFLGLWGGPQQHHLSRQHFGVYVFEKQQKLFLLPKIVDFIKTWKKSAPQMKIECPRAREAEISAEVSVRGAPTNMLPICNIT